MNQKCHSIFSTKGIVLAKINEYTKELDEYRLEACSSMERAETNHMLAFDLEHDKVYRIKGGIKFVNTLIEPVRENDPARILTRLILYAHEISEVNIEFTMFFVNKDDRKYNDNLVYKTWTHFLSTLNLSMTLWKK